MGAAEALADAGTPAAAGAALMTRARVGEPMVQADATGAAGADAAGVAGGGGGGRPREAAGFAVFAVAAFASCAAHKAPSEGDALCTTCWFVQQLKPQTLNPATPLPQHQPMCRLQKRSHVTCAFCGATGRSATFSLLASSAHPLQVAPHGRVGRGFGDGVLLRRRAIGEVEGRVREPALVAVLTPPANPVPARTHLPSQMQT